MSEEQKASAGVCFVPGATWAPVLETGHQAWGCHSQCWGDMESRGAPLELLPRLDKRGVCPGCGAL